MKKYVITFLIIVISTCHALAQTDNLCNCCSASHKAFDFWIGNWTVYNSDGKIIGTNNVVKMQDGCVLQENWVASNKTNTGTSYNFFDLSDNTWNQVWISNSGNVLNLKGNINKDGVMILKSNLIYSEKGNYYNQITWLKNIDGSVVQQWDILNENSQPINKSFEGIYKKPKAD